MARLGKSEELLNASTVGIAVLLAPRVRARLEAMAHRHGRSITEEVRFALTKYVESDALQALAPRIPNQAEDPIHGFIAAKLGFEGSTMPAGEVWDLWKAYCTERGLLPGSQKAFGIKAKKWLGWESNNNRPLPRYLNVRAKVAAVVPKADLQVVVDNTRTA